MSAEYGPGALKIEADLPERDDALEDAGGDQTPELWSWLPRLSLRQVQLEGCLGRWTGVERGVPWLDWLRTKTNQAIELGRPEITWRAAGLHRPGLIAQFRWPRRNTRLGVGLEVPLAHAVVDGLLGYDRPFAESRLQLTPVEWGVWSYLIVRSIEEFHGQAREKDRA